MSDDQKCMRYLMIFPVALINGGLSQAEYNKQVKALNREFDEDYNDIFAG